MVLSHWSPGFNLVVGNCVILSWACGGRQEMEPAMKKCMILRFQVRTVSSPSDAIYRQTYYKLKVWELKPNINAICCLTSANLFRTLDLMPACLWDPLEPICAKEVYL